MEGENDHPHKSKKWLEDMSKGLLRELDAISLGGLSFTSSMLRRVSSAVNSSSQNTSQTKTEIGTPEQ
ncbi:hypothetical protein RHMOL_Rhmol04G0208100 [Rhododendron molle]|uniref:Uncharacterized protein n=1 Tax=Rhododendron molle TaxID=49168 RepID=A0ACC0P4V2_RHOML|nr:hypothetical protein RHMOL_Rhmol04G0208100 [Rhododendron molle]